jgi:hypothetical protein
MAVPSYKAPVIAEALDAIFGRSGAIVHDQCVMDITHNASQFRDVLSAQEYTISGMCQTCQDAIFGGDERV